MHTFYQSKLKFNNTSFHVSSLFSLVSMALKMFTSLKKIFLKNKTSLKPLIIDIDKSLPESSISKISSSPMGLQIIFVTCHWETRRSNNIVLLLLLINTELLYSEEDLYCDICYPQMLLLSIYFPILRIPCE